VFKHTKKKYDGEISIKSTHARTSLYLPYLPVILYHTALPYLHVS